MPKPNSKMVISLICLSAAASAEPVFTAASDPEMLRVTTVDPKGATSAVVRVEVPIAGIDEMWTPDRARPVQGRKWRVTKNSAPQSDFPFVAYFAANGENAFAFGSSSLEYDNELSSKINQEKGVFELTLAVATDGEPIQPFKVTVDRRPGDWTAALAAWRSGLGCRRGRYPDGAWKPVYCTWHAAHADFDQNWIEREAKIAAELGFKTFILDDGWSYDERKRVNPETIGTWYRDVGRWDAFSKDKFSDFAAHRERMRRLGLNYLVWVAPYFVGTRTQLYRLGRFAERGEKPFEGCALADVKDTAFMNRVSDQLVRLVKTADLDGLKIDFLDQARPSLAKPRAGAARKYMAELMKRLREVKPNGLFEFRQSCATPYTAALGTQFRAGDAPFDWQANLLEILQIRLAMGDGVPVHADPIHYSKCETADNIDRHFLAAMAGVPTVSMDLEDMDHAERQRVQRWLEFYRNRIESFQRSGRWSVRYRNGSLAAAWAERGNSVLAFACDPGCVATLERHMSGRQVLLVNLSHEPIAMRGVTVAAAAYGDIPISASRKTVPACDPRTMGPTGDYAKYYMARQNWFMEHKNAIGQDGIVFLGDSITELLQGTKAYKEHFAREPGRDFKALNLANEGERTENVLWHIESGQLDGYRPKAVVVAIGTNNLGNDYPKEDVWQAVELIIDRLRKHQPGVPILLQGIFPRGWNADDPLRRRAAEFNVGYRRIAAEKDVRYLALWDEFLEPDGVLTKDIMSDGLHPTEKAAEIWIRHLLPALREVVSSPRGYGIISE